MKVEDYVDFHCRRCLEGENGLFQSVLLKEVVIEPNVKLECVPKFYYLGDTLGAGKRGGGSSKGQSEMCLGKVQGVISYSDGQGCIIPRRIHNTLDHKTACTIVTSLIHSKLDYCNSVYI